MTSLALLFPFTLPFFAKTALVFAAIPLVAVFGLLYLLWRFLVGVRLAMNLRRIATERLCCPSGHQVLVYGKWRCPACHAIWEGPGHRCPCCYAPMKYLICQHPGCGLAAKLPRFWP